MARMLAGAPINVGDSNPCGTSSNRQSASDGAIRSRDPAFWCGLVLPNRTRSRPPTFYAKGAASTGAAPPAGAAAPWDATHSGDSLL
jgi:hypothetical protein